MTLTKKLKLEELGRVSLDDYRELPKTKLIIVLDNVRSMHNVGAFFRTGDAFLIEKILLVGITPTPPHREIHKSALGATESVSWEHYPSIEEALRKLKEENYTIVGVEQTNDSMLLEEYTISQKPYALVFGNEVDGISDEALPLCDDFVEIAQFGTKHSLNVSVCGGIVMHHFFSSMKL